MDVQYGKGTNRITGDSHDNLLIDMKCTPKRCDFTQIDPFEEEGKSNALLLQFLSSLLNIPLLNLSMSHERNRLAVRVGEMDYEDFYMRLKSFIPLLSCSTNTTIMN